MPSKFSLSTIATKRFWYQKVVLDPICSKYNTHGYIVHRVGQFALTKTCSKLLCDKINLSIGYRELFAVYEVDRDKSNY